MFFKFLLNSDIKYTSFSRECLKCFYLGLGFSFLMFLKEMLIPHPEHFRVPIYSSLIYLD